MSFVLTWVLGAFGIPTVVLAATLTTLLVLANDISWGPSLELFFAMSWLSTVVHILWALPWLGVLGFERLRRRAVLGPWGQPASLAGWILSVDVVWAVWNRVGMAHQPMSVRPFLTLQGVLENLTLLAAALLLFVGLATLLARSLHWRGWGCALSSGFLLAAVLGWNARTEGEARTVDLREFSGHPTAPAGATVQMDRRAGPVIVLGIDGLSWATLAPLIRGGHTPNLAKLVASGAIASLDNHEESLSARIWNTVFSGRLPERHGVFGFTKLVLNGSETPLHNLLLSRPSIDTFFGLEHLLARVPSLGLWTLEQTGASDRRVKMMWDVLSEHGDRVVIANPMSSVPVQPVRGAHVVFREAGDPDTMFPPELAERWSPDPYRDPSGRSPEGFEDHWNRMLEEIRFTADLMHEQDPDVAVYYTHFVDTISHCNWDFYSRDRFFLRGRPAALDSIAWEEMVLRNVDDPVFRCYRLLDEAIAPFLEEFPSATWIVCSDHGWTYSGYEHFGSPEGVLIIAGPGVRRVVLERARLEDITPTVLALRGVPLAPSLEGRVLEEAFDWVPTLALGAEYGAPAPVANDPVADPEELARLRALGYVD